MTSHAETADPRVLLRSHGLRVTAPRVAVLDALVGHPHATVDAVAARARGVLGSVSTQAVYDVLRVCTTAGIVRRFEPAGSAARYETRTADNHHHLVCRTCGVVVDVDCAVGAAPCLTPSHVAGAADGFVVDEAEVVFWGTCTDCRTGDPERSSSATPASGTIVGPETSSDRQPPQRGDKS